MNREDALTGKAGLAGVQWMLRGKPIRRRIHHEVRNLLSPGWVPGYLRLTRVKFKPGRKLSLYFNSPAYSKERELISTRPVAVSWRLDEKISGSPESLVSVQDEIIRRGLAGPFDHLWSQSEDANLEVLVSPLDPAFEQLVRLNDPQHVREQLDKLAEFSQNPSVDYQITPVRYRPGERHVLRYAADHRGDAGVMYVKLYKQPAAALRAARIASRITDWLAAQGGLLRGARPQAVFEADAAILYPKILGTPVSRLLQRPSPKVLEVLVEAGRGLRSLHDGPPSLAADLFENPADKEIQAISRASEHLQVLLPTEYDRIQVTLARATEILSSLPQEPFTFTHSDFKSDHLLVAPGKLTLIDFDTCALADPALDVGKFLADLDYWFTMDGIPGSDQAQAAFLSGYAPQPMEDRLARAAVYHTLVLVKITVRRVRLFDRAWADKTARLLQKAEILLNKAVSAQPRTLLKPSQHFQ